MLTKDDRIRCRVTERAARAAARVRAFVLSSSQLQVTEMAAAFVKHFREQSLDGVVKISYVYRGIGPWLAFGCDAVLER